METLPRSISFLITIQHERVFDREFYQPVPLFSQKRRFFFNFILLIKRVSKRQVQSILNAKTSLLAYIDRGNEAISTSNRAVSSTSISTSQKGEKT